MCIPEICKTGAVFGTSPLGSTGFEQVREEETCRLTPLGSECPLSSDSCFLLPNSAFEPGCSATSWRPWWSGWMWQMLVCWKKADGCWVRLEKGHQWRQRLKEDHLEGRRYHWALSTCTSLERERERVQIKIFKATYPEICWLIL